MNAPQPLPDRLPEAPMESPPGQQPDAAPSSSAALTEGAVSQAEASLAVAGLPDPVRQPPDPVLLEAVNAWRARLALAGFACRAVTVEGPDPAHRLPLPDGLGDLALRWERLRQQLTPAAPFQMSRPEGQGGDLLVATALQMPDGQLGAIGIALPPPHTDRSVQWLMLSLGWLQLALTAPRVERSLRAGRLLELLGHVASQQQSRAAAQEWINRTAGWLRELAEQEQTAAAVQAASLAALRAGAAYKESVADPAQTPPPLSLMLFEVRNDRPRWWVSADAAWAEHAAPAVQHAADVAMQALHEQGELRLDEAWAQPALADGETQAVLVLLHARGTLSESQRQLLRASLAAAEPLLRQWRLAQRPLWRHALQALGDGWRRFHRPGHLAWKVGAVGVALAAAVLLLWPVPDRVTAQGTIEGRQRLIVTAPFDGFIGQVLVRPGAQVQAGQLLARMDDRDLRLEQARYVGEREQAAGRLRQAMSERDAPAVALASAEVQQSEAQLQLVEAKLARARLIAPQAGLLVTGDWAQQVGSPVETGKEMFEIASGDGYRVVLHVPDRDIRRVHEGQPGQLRLTGQPDASHAFRVVTVTATATVQDNVNGFRVEADWVGAVPAIRPGMQGVGKVEVGTANLLTIWTRSSIDWLRLKLWAWGW